MQKIIDKILEGNFDYENDPLDFSCAKIEFSIQKGQQYEGSFRILVPAGLYTGGMVYSSDWRMECLTEEFSGEEEIAFRFHGEKLEEDYEATAIDDAGDATGKIELAEDEYFVLGDDRGNSEDSRDVSVGNVKRAYIYGKAWFVASPWGSFGLI